MRKGPSHIAKGLLVGLVLGVAASLTMGDYLREGAREDWVAKADRETETISAVLYSRLNESVTILHAYASLFHANTDLDNARFVEAYNKTQSWNSEVSFESIAYARSVSPDARTEIAKELGHPSVLFGSPATRSRAPVGRIHHHADERSRA